MVYIGGVGIGAVYNKVNTQSISQNRRRLTGIEELSGAAARTGKFNRKMKKDIRKQNGRGVREHNAKTDMSRNNRKLRVQYTGKQEISRVYSRIHLKYQEHLKNKVSTKDYRSH